jgi:hypothetical protein
VCNVPYVIKDTSDFLQKLESVGHIPSTAILCTIDVIGLYPHIPHGEGLEALPGAFNRAEWELPVEDLVSLARLVLENNYFEFDEKIFRQKLGTAIGTKFAPGFANILMGHLEEKFLETCELKPWVWWRFLDDIFVMIFFASFEFFYENIKYTWDISYHRISFLDVSVGLDNGFFVLMCIVNPLMHIKI